ncbi:unnamed protein product [Prorocentrum cordatum]|uniref:Uncharacterized protein n=1 Tax=Prorocentrum cordatum TaxID=2364126 RepID=A0ABN9SES3_9DINO|nr:unnamed protein product [Polarella glacialis]
MSSPASFQRLAWHRRLVQVQAAQQLHPPAQNRYFSDTAKVRLLEAGPGCAEAAHARTKLALPRHNDGEVAGSQRTVMEYTPTQTASKVQDLPNAEKTNACWPLAELSRTRYKQTGNTALRNAK